MAGVQKDREHEAVYDDDHLLVIDAPVKESINLSTTTSITYPASLDPFNTTLRQPHPSFKLTVSNEAYQPRPTLTDKLRANTKQRKDSESAIHFQSAMPIEQVDEIVAMLSKPKMATVPYKNEPFESGGKEIAPELIIESYRSLVSALNAFYAANEKNPYKEQRDKLAVLQAALEQAKKNNDLVQYAKSYHALSIYIQSESYTKLHASMELMTTYQQTYLSRIMRGPKFHQENYDTAFKEIDENVNNRKNIASIKGFSAEKVTKTQQEENRLKQLDVIKKRYMQAFVPKIVEALIKDFALNPDPNGKAYLKKFNTEITSATTAISNNATSVFAFAKIQAVTDARVLLADIQRTIDDASNYIQEKLNDPKKYFDSLDKKTTSDELISLQKQQLKIAETQIIAYRKNCHIVHLNQWQKMHKSLAIVTNKKFSSFDELMKKLTEIAKLKRVLQASMLDAETQSAQFIAQYKRQQTFINHKCFSVINDNNDKKVVINFAENTIKEQKVLQENQQKLADAINEEENKCFLALDEFKQDLPSIYNAEYYDDAKLVYFKKLDTIVDFIRKVADKGFHYPVAHYPKLIVFQNDQRKLLDYLASFLNDLNANIQQLTMYLKIMEENYPHKKPFISSLAGQLTHLNELKIELSLKQNQAINAFIYTEKHIKDLACFYGNEIELELNDLSVDTLFSSAKAVASYNYLLGNGELMPRQSMDNLKKEALQKLSVIKKLQYQLSHFPKTDVNSFLDKQKKTLQNKLSEAEEKLQLIIKNDKYGIIGYGKNKVFILNNQQVMSHEVNKVLFKDLTLYNLILERGWALKSNAELIDYRALHTCFTKVASFSKVKNAIKKIVFDRIPGEDLVIIHQLSKQHLYHAHLENSLLKQFVNAKIIKSTSFLRHFSESYGTLAKLAPLNAAIAEPISDDKFKVLLADVGIVLTAAQLSQVQAENKALAAKRALITVQAAEFQATSRVNTQEPTRLQRWTQHAKNHPVKTAVLAVSACVLFKPVLVAAGVVSAAEAFKADKKTANHAVLRR